MPVSVPASAHRPEAGGHLCALPGLLHRPDDSGPQQICALQVSRPAGLEKIQKSERFEFDMTHLIKDRLGENRPSFSQFSLPALIFNSSSAPGDLSTNTPRIIFFLFKKDAISKCVLTI